MKNLILITTIFLAFSINAFSQTVTLESAKAAFAAKNYEKAADEFKTLTKEAEYKKDAAVWNYLALSYRGLNNDSDALEAIERAAKLRPDVKNFQLNYATILAEAGSRDALRKLDDILEKYPDWTEAKYLRAKTYASFGEFEDAKKDAQALIDKDPKSVNGYVLITEILENEMNARIIRKRSSPEKEVRFLIQSMEVLNDGRTACGDCKDRDLFDYYLNIRQLLIDNIPRSDKEIKAIRTSWPTNDPKDHPPQVIHSAWARYTNTARERNITGTVSMIFVYGASGKVEGVIVRRYIGGGLDENAIAAVRRTEFVPGVRNGKPVSSVDISERIFRLN